MILRPGSERVQFWYSRIRKLPFPNATQENQESTLEWAFTRPVLGRIS